MIGQSSHGRLLFVVYTETDPTVRLISARLATATERKNDEDTEKAELDPLAPRDLDWSKAVRSKYNNLLAEGTHVAIIEPELLEHFRIPSR